MKSKEAVENVEKSPTKMPARYGIRHLQAIMLFLGLIVSYCLRVSISIAVVPMKEMYGWTIEKDSVLSAFFWGYAVIQVPSGYIASIWNAQKLLSVGILVCGVLNILTPVAANYGNYIVVCICRAAMGLFQGCLYPCCHTILSKWVPPSERSTLGTVTYAGAQLGTVICFPIAGVIAGSSLGWPSIFYVFGAAALIWSVAFFIIGSESPAEDSRITKAEREYIEEAIREDEGKKTVEIEGKKKIPWKAMLFSTPMAALIIVHCAQNWGYWTLVTELPSYMNDVLEFAYEENGLMAALPYLTMWILSFPMCLLADLAVKKGVSRGTTRKVCNTIAHWGPAVALICLAALPIPNSMVAVAILVIAVGLNAGSLCGFQINHMDLSPNFAGTMMSITNCFASFTAIIAPLICSAIVEGDEKNSARWNIVFYLAAAIYFVGNLIFIILGQANVQPWNEPETYELSVRKQSTGPSVITVKE